MKERRFWHTAAVLTLLAAATGAGAGAVMFLWNALLPALCGFSAIGYVQALGLLLLGGTLSGGILLPLAMLGHALAPRHSHNRHELLKKWRNMSDEERRQFFEARGFHADRP